jgi:hypothetical protein
MFRIAAPLVAMAMLAESAAGQSLPEIDIKAHCTDVDGGAERVTACIANEKQARLWLETHRTDPRILYQCSQTLDLSSAGYVLLLACVLAKRHM